MTTAICNSCNHFVTSHRNFAGRFATARCECCQRFREQASGDFDELADALTEAFVRITAETRRAVESIKAVMQSVTDAIIESGGLRAKQLEWYQQQTIGPCRESDCDAVAWAYRDFRCARHFHMTGRSDG